MTGSALRVNGAASCVPASQASVHVAHHVASAAVVSWDLAGQRLQKGDEVRDLREALSD